MHRNCDECTRLWNEYALVTRHFLKLEGKVQIADISRDASAVQLRPLLVTAAADRADLRRQIKQHESRGAGRAIA